MRLTLYVPIEPVLHILVYMVGSSPTQLISCINHINTTPTRVDILPLPAPTNRTQHRGGKLRVR